MSKEGVWIHSSFILSPAQQGTQTWKGNLAFTVPAMLLLLWRCPLHHSVVAAWFHFISLHRPVLFQTLRFVNVVKLSVGAALLLFTFRYSVNESFGIDTNNFWTPHCAADNVLSICCMTFWRWQSGSGSFNKRKTNLASESWRSRILNSITFLYASFHTVRSISKFFYSMLLELKANNDLVGGPVKPLKLEKHVGQSDVNGNIHQIFKVS